MSAGKNKNFVYNPAAISSVSMRESAQARISHDHSRRHVPHPSAVACFPSKRPTKEWTLVDANDDRPIESLP